MDELESDDLIDWHGCLAVRFDPERLSGKATVGDSRLDADTVVINYESGMSVEELYDHFRADRDAMREIIAFYEATQMKIRA